MAQYKVPQDVEADDKLIGPFSFRQFVYLLVAAGMIALAVGMFQLFPLLAILPIPIALFFLALALPLKKDQPMETYLAAIASYYLKPRTKRWMPGQRDTNIIITAPKIVNDVRTRDISEEEATHRLAFLSDIVDTEGYAIKGAGASPMREDLVAEAAATPDMFETYQSQVINRVIDQDKMSRHDTAVNEMRDAIARNSNGGMIPDEPTVGGGRVIQRMGASAGGTGAAVINPAAVAASAAAVGAATSAPVVNSAPGTAAMQTPAPAPVVLDKNTQPSLRNMSPVTNDLRMDAVLKPDVDLENSDVVVRPEINMNEKTAKKAPQLEVASQPEVAGEKSGNSGADGKNANDAASAANSANAKKVNPNPVNDSIMELANNTDFSVATIAKQANRINRKDQGEIFVSLH